MNPIIRNLLSVVRRFRLAAVLNVLGLSVAFAAFIIIMIQLDYDYGFDKCHKDYDKIFRLEIYHPDFARAIICRPFAEHFFESSPHILAGALSASWERNLFFYLENNGIRNLYEENSKTISPGYAEIFSFDFVEGSKDALKIPGNVLIPLSLSRKLFGNRPAAGEKLGDELTVGAVYRDFPANTIVSNCIYVPLPEMHDKQNWNDNSYHVYIRVNDSSNATLLLENYKRIMEDKSLFGGQEILWYNEHTNLRLTALANIHFIQGVNYDNTPKTSKQTLMILFAIAILIIVIAAINFTNFSTALTPMRVKSINTQRVFGARRNAMRLTLVFEAVVISLMSYLVALLLVSLFRDSSFAKLVDADLSFSAHPLIVGGTALAALLTGVLAGLYPARYMTSFAPALVLKGSFGLSPKGKILRNTLIGIQYVSSFALILGATFMYLQNYYMQHGPLGYDKDNMIVTDISRILAHREAFTNELKAYSGIEDITYGQNFLSSRDNYSSWGRRNNGKTISFSILAVDYNYLQVMGIETTEGRHFRQEDGNTGAFIFNETARKQYDLELNSMIDGHGEIVGFMPDIKFASFRKMVDPMAFYVFFERQSGLAHIKLKKGADVHAAMSHIHSTLAGFNADYTFNVRFYDEVVQRLYEKETSLSTLISLFSLIAIFISIVGVFGLVVFDSECRRREIGIRKVLGASTLGIIVMFNKAYFRILAVCFVVAAPLAWYAVNRWLENFAYKTTMYWWVYALAFLAVGIITASTVTFQNWRVANDNPAKAIKSE